jgi:hypothetical protein
MEYKEIFRHRGESYDLAMKKYPNARDNEFKQLFYKIPLNKKEVILDIPALGGYLKKYCLDDTQIIFLDFSKSINKIDIVSPYESWNIPKINRIVCLAAVHHIENLNLFLNNLSGHLADKGVIHLADVSANSQISKFLDEFVGSNTSTGGHDGKYYDWKKISFPKELIVIDIEERNCPWKFESEENMIEYCKLLFDLKDVSNNQILYALNKYIGFEKVNDNIILNWHLTYIDLQKI